MIRCTDDGRLQTFGIYEERLCVIANCSHKEARDLKADSCVVIVLVALKECLQRPLSSVRNKELGSMFGQALVAFWFKSTLQIFGMECEDHMTSYSGSQRPETSMVFPSFNDMLPPSPLPYAYVSFRSADVFLQCLGVHIIEERYKTISSVQWPKECHTVKVLVGRQVLDNQKY